MYQCNHCGHSFAKEKVRQRTCADCKKARKAAEARARRAAGWVEPRLTVPHSCRGCGVEFFPRRKEFNKYCSRGCAFSDAGSWAGQRPRVLTEYRAHLKRGYRLNLQKPALRIIECAWCSIVFSAVPWAKYVRHCSDECSASSRATAKQKARQTDWFKASRRKAKARRKARLRGAIGGVAIDPLTIFERDQWHCKGCGCWTPKDLRGTCHDNAPEMDHKMPIAKGGKHIDRNLQTLCRLCNGLKSDMYWNEFKRKYL